MKHKLFIKFLLVYAAMAVASFVLISTVGSSMINSYLVGEESKAIYQLAQDLTIRYENSKTFNSESLYESLKNIAGCENARIIIVAPTGEKLLDTNEIFDISAHNKIDDFDPVALGTGYYSIGDFFGQFDSETMSVMLPMTHNMMIRGYISIHVAMSEIYADREQILGIIHTISVMIFGFVLLIFVLQSIWIYRPLNKIIKGAQALAAGNLSNKITLNSHDEMGDLAETLNYMGSEINKQTEYQHQFIANVSHDFRSPLTSIKGYVEAIKDGIIPPEMMGKYLDIILFETNRLNKLTSELLSLDNIDDRVRKMNHTVFDMNRLIRETALSFEGTCTNKGISFVLLLEENELNVYADYARIQQVMYNLIDNAIKFSNTNSKIQIETTRKKDKVYISIKDQGVGIPNKDLPKIWQRFYKTDSSRGKDRTGTGLGLSIVKDILTAHNQKITVVSTEGVGTEFYFTLDAAHEELDS